MGGEQLGEGSGSLKGTFTWTMKMLRSFSVAETDQGDERLSHERQKGGDQIEVKKNSKKSGGGKGVRKDRIIVILV